MHTWAVEITGIVILAVIAIALFITIGVNPSIADRNGMIGGAVACAAVALFGVPFAYADWRAKHGDND